MHNLSRIHKAAAINICLVLAVTLSACQSTSATLVPASSTTKTTPTLSATSSVSGDEIVAKVNSTEITVAQFQTRVKYQRLTLTQTFINYQTSAYASYFQTQLLEVQNELDDTLQFGSNVLDGMIQEEVINQKAKELGFTVSDEDVNKQIEESFGLYENGTPTPAPTIAFRPTSTYSPTQLAIVTLAPVPTETQAPAVEATATATETAPTSTPFTREEYNNQYATLVASLDSQAGFGDEELRTYVRDMLLSQKLYESVTKNISDEQEMVWARHILVATEAEANTVLDKLKAGEDFAALAAQYSTDTSNSTTGGDLGWFSKGQMVQAFEDAAWALKIGEISKPVQTDFGYHIIQALGHENRQMTADQLSTAKSAAYQTYVDNLVKNATTEKFDVWQTVVPTEPSIPTEYRISTAQ
jgi:peptidyl-prolyl cis-trans isomerase D